MTKITVEYNNDTHKYTVFVDDCRTVKTSYDLTLELCKCEDVSNLDGIFSREFSKMAFTRESTTVEVDFEAFFDPARYFNISTEIARRVCKVLEAFEEVANCYRTEYYAFIGAKMYVEVIARKDTYAAPTYTYKVNSKSMHEKSATLLLCACDDVSVEAGIFSTTDSEMTFTRDNISVTYTFDNVWDYAKCANPARGLIHRAKQVRKALDAKQQGKIQTFTAEF